MTYRGFEGLSPYKFAYLRGDRFSGEALVSVQGGESEEV